MASYYNMLVAGTENINTASLTATSITAPSTPSYVTGPAVVNTTATTLAVTATQHGGKTVTVSSTAPIAITLPAATGSGTKYNFLFLVAATGTASTISTAASAEIVTGYSFALTTSSDNVIGYKTTATDNTVSFNGGTKGGFAGDSVAVQDVGTSTWSIQITANATGTTATPFSHV